MIDPLDYETVISELADDLKEDPLRELLLFPDNDFSVSATAILCLCPVDKKNIYIFHRIFLLKQSCCICVVKLLLSCNHSECVWKRVFIGLAGLHTLTPLAF